MSRKKLYKLTIAFTFLVIIVIVYSLRSPIVSFVAQKRVVDFKKKYGASISFSNLKVRGVRTITITNVKVSLPNDSLLLDAHNLKVKLALPELLSFKANPLYLGFDSLTININPNILSMYPEVSKQDTTNKNTVNEFFNPIGLRYASRIIRTILGVSTSEIDFKNFRVNFFGSNSPVSIYSPCIKSVNGYFYSRFEVVEDGSQNFFQISGNSSKPKNSVCVKMFGEELSPVHLPLTQTLFGLDLNFDSLSFIFEANIIESDTIHFSGFSKILGLKVSHRQLSESEVLIDSGSFRFGFGVNPLAANFDRGSVVSLNQFVLPFELEIENSLKPRVIFQASTGCVKASNLFESLPQGLFSTLQGIKVDGDINFEIKTDIDFANPDSLSFYAKLTPINFKIVSFGKEDFSLLNDTLTYTVYVNDTLNKFVHLHPDYKSFCSIENISPHLKNAVLTSEDGGFYSHLGFDPEGFRYALVQNIKQRRMARGGSTITMQLVKNIYLNHSKNLVRKAEEALIVWLIETQRIVEKDRLLEIYFNIIEWGPCINGITEASEFYFEKLPLELELNEAIFLASIVPKPNFFMYNFDSEKNLKPFMTDFYSFVASKMLERGTISLEEFETLTPNVELKGKALDFIRNQLVNDYIDTTDIIEMNVSFKE